MQDRSSWAISMRKDRKSGRIIIRSEDRIFNEPTVEAAMEAFYASMEEPEEKFHGFQIGDSVRITSRKTEIIFSSSGERVGFPDAAVGQVGKIVAFDRTTRSLKTVCVEMAQSGETVWGSHREIRLS